MKKRVEKVVECVKNGGFLTEGKRYKVYSESKENYSVMYDEGHIGCWIKEDFKVVSEREVLEFEGDDLSNPYFLHNSPSFIPIKQEIDLTKYNIKVIATPKDNPLESKSKEELIEIIKELKEKE